MEESALTMLQWINLNQNNRFVVAYQYPTMDMAGGISHVH